MSRVVTFARVHAVPGRRRCVRAPRAVIGALAIAAITSVEAAWQPAQRPDEPAVARGAGATDRFVSSSAVGGANWASILGEAREAGRGTLRFLGMRVYEAVLWVGAAVPAERRRTELSPPFDRDFVLELRYAMDLSGARIAERSDQEMGRQPDHASAAQRARWLEQMRAIFPDVRAGDVLAGVYRAGGASRFLLNGRSIGEISDPAFGRAFFGIWLDARTSEPSLREALLRGLEAAPGLPARALRPLAPAQWTVTASDRGR